MNMKLLTLTAGNNTSANSSDAEVSKDYGIEFCSNTPKHTQLKAVPEQFNTGPVIALQLFYNWDLEMLVNYIIDFHHQYLKNNAVIIYDLAQKVLYSHSKNHPEFKKLASQIFLFLHGLLNHLMKKERILFPEMKQLIKNRGIPGIASYVTFGLIKDAVSLMQKQHLVAEEDMNLLRKITNNYKASKNTSSLCNYLFKKMREFEDHLLMNIYVEKNILFPKVISANEALE